MNGYGVTYTSWVLVNKDTGKMHCSKKGGRDFSYNSRAEARIAARKLGYFVRRATITVELR
ncbi:MAG: hypothetical protein IMZ62_17335 [Chloroflexi bacterium]|nr:hypothetical protein [Chloroflexota bacterium]